MKKEHIEEQTEVEVTEAEVGEAKAEISELDNVKMQLARALADYDNLRKRVDRERTEMSELTTYRFVMRFLPIFDMIKDAQKHLNDAGLGISLKVLADTLKEEGIIEIEAKSGMIFDHELHEAVDTIETDEHEDNEIAEVVLAGYKFIEGPVIRHAKVKVYKRN